MKITFPKEFIWGVATAAYQIEGGWNEGGKGESIWDRFSHTPGKIQDGTNGDVACDHYHRWQEDIALMRSLGLKAYRFSVSWPRILPEGTGEVNPAGLDFYDRLVDALLENGIEPVLTLYHWDLPQVLQDRGGWPNRATAEAFGEYTRVVGERLGDRINYWITHNEPMVTSLVGHFLGRHPPGIQDQAAAMATAVNLLISHGLGVQALRTTCHSSARIGITLNLCPVHPASDAEADVQAAHRFDMVINRLFLDPVLRGSYPEELTGPPGALFPTVTAEDLTLMSTPIDFLGVNYYSRAVVRYDPDSPFILVHQSQPVGNEYSQMWEIYPPGIYELLTRIRKEYLVEANSSLRLLITENGVCVPDGIDFDGRVRDYRRIRYIREHLAQIKRAMDDDVPVDGYFVWSLMDNFEWAYGYNMRFGLVYVDYPTQKRIPKDSALWYKETIAQNGFSMNRNGSD